MLKKIVRWTAATAAAGVIAVLLVGQTGLLHGQPPGDLGVRDGRLKAPSQTPNSVSSQAGLWAGHPRAAEAAIAPLPLRGTHQQTLALLQRRVQETPGAVVVKAEGDYLYATFTSRWLKFTDDVEFWFDPSAQVIQVRSASRLGKGDMGVNRARVESLRAWLLAAS